MKFIRSLKEYENNMKRILIFAFVLLSACVAEARPLRVVATVTDLADITRRVGGQKVEVTSLSRGTEDLHYVEVRPSMVVSLRRADLLVVLGMDADPWVYGPLDSARNSRIRFGRSGYLDASVGIEKLDVPTGRIDGSMGHVHAYGNPHYMLDPESGRIVARSIAERLSQLSPEDEGYFRENLERFEAELDENISRWKELLSPHKGAPIVTYHETWPYFAKRFGLEVAVTLEPKPGIPPSPRHLREVVREVQRRDIGVILMEPFYSARAAEFVAEQTGAKVVVAPDQVRGDKEAGDYIALIDLITRRLEAALSSQ